MRSGVRRRGAVTDVEIKSLGKLVGANNFFFKAWVLLSSAVGAQYLQLYRALSCKFVGIGHTLISSSFSRFIQILDFEII